MENNVDIRRMILDHVIDNAPRDSEWEDIFTSLFERLSTDDLVEWLMFCRFGHDEDAVISAFGEEIGQAILDYYEAHRL